jgi:hypothetical protein
MAYSQKFQSSSVKLRSSYALFNENRPKTVLMTTQEYYRLFDKYEEKMAEKPSPAGKVPKELKAKSTPQVFGLCRAYKMDGCVCNAKIKLSGTEFCVRHSKKTT